MQVKLELRKTGLGFVRADLKNGADITTIPEDTIGLFRRRPLT